MRCRTRLRSSVFPTSDFYSVSLEKKERVYLAENKAIINDDEFEHLFKAHFKELFAYAFTIVRDDITAEEIVQNLFLKLWEKRSLLNNTSVKAYLYKCVYHDSLNYLRHLKVRNRFTEQTTYLNNSQQMQEASVKTEFNELEHHLRNALNELPQQCRTVFQMSRFEELKYREIAEQLNISVKTVEIHMTKALKFLRLRLADFLPVLLYLVQYISFLMMMP